MTGEVHNLYTIITNQYANETQTLGQIVTAAREGIIHPSLMTPQELASTLKSIELTIKKQYSIPMGTKASELNKFQKITKMSIYYENDNLVFITKIPLVIDIELTLYHLIPIPIIHVQNNTEGWYLLTVTYNNIAITKDRKRFTTYTEKQLDDCTETTIYRICRTPQPIQENSERQPCELQLFKGPDTTSNQRNCAIEKFNLQRNIYHKLRNKNTWLHVGSEALTVSCTDMVEPFTLDTNKIGEITIVNNNCQVFTQDAVLTATEEITNTNYKDFIPTTNIKKHFREDT
ncbi:uncharacterized protein LOC132932669 [Metopolophium dirhodum]|uniref:uncharacterized protein LOC132932669 n=1 Tax=Metopolophium dirhodum TaxID=44670 RepID=UPI00298FA5E8|nr:uncharacterized protein LOC132932669 [Metopolophium dirhodum]